MSTNRGATAGVKFAIVQIHLANPDLTLKEIGEQVGRTVPSVSAVLGAYHRAGGIVLPSRINKRFPPLPCAGEDIC